MLYQRVYQISQKGQNPDLINQLAHDAQRWAELSRVLKLQLPQAKKIIREHYRRYNDGGRLSTAQNALDSFGENVNARIGMLDQATRDLLQLVRQQPNINSYMSKS